MSARTGLTATLADMAKLQDSGALQPADVSQRIRFVRRHRVLLDTDLASLYGVPTHRFNAATILNSEVAVEMSVHVVRAFVSLRQVLASQTGLASRLQALERAVSNLDASTRKEFVRVCKSIHKLMGPAAPEQQGAQMKPCRHDILTSLASMTTLNSTCQSENP